MRIAQYIAHHSVHSRKQVSRLIASERVTINGLVARDINHVQPNDDIRIDGQPVVEVSKRIVYRYHKPEGLDCNLDKPSSILPICQHIAQLEGVPRVFPIGRLDKDSCGLLVLTNDGELCHQLIHSEFEIEKTYLVRVDKAVTDEQLKRLNQPFAMLNKQTLPANVTLQADKQLQFVLTQGLNRQIRRMCKAVGLRVEFLQRIQFYDLPLANLAEGEFERVCEQIVTQIATQG